MSKATNSRPKALITGASSGIGAVYADRLAKRGYDLILVARDLPRLNAVADRARRETGRRVEVITADLSVKANILQIETLIQADTALTMVVNNAGYSANEKFVDADPDDIEAMITVNITALTRLSNAAAKAFAKTSSGTIINIGSGVAMIPDQFNGVYGGTKAYVLNFTRNIAAQLKDHNVVVQAVLPGAIHTEAWDRAGDTVSAVPKEAIMTVDDLVDASLAGLDQGEIVTLPSLENLAAWSAFEEARLAMIPQIFNGKPASRYR